MDEPVPAPERLRPPDNFRFEAACAAIDWRKVASTNVARLQRRGDAEALRGFVGEVAMGQVDDGEMHLHPSHVKLFQLLQLQTQYLLFCHQTLRERSAEVDRGLKKIQHKQASVKRKALARKERVRTLAADAQAQDEILATYHAMLEVSNPQLAARVASADDGRLVLLEPQPLRRAARRGARRTRQVEEEEEEEDPETEEEEDSRSGGEESGSGSYSDGSWTDGEDASVSRSEASDLLFETASRTLPREDDSAVGVPLSPLRWRGASREMPASAAGLSSAALDRAEDGVCGDGGGGGPPAPHSTTVLN